MKQGHLIDKESKWSQNLRWLFSKETSEKNSITGSLYLFFLWVWLGNTDSFNSHMLCFKKSFLTCHDLTCWSCLDYQHVFQWNYTKHNTAAYLRHPKCRRRTLGLSSSWQMLNCSMSHFVDAWFTSPSRWMTFQAKSSTGALMANPIILFSRPAQRHTTQVKTKKKKKKYDFFLRILNMLFILSFQQTAKSCLRVALDLKLGYFKLKLHTGWPWIETALV